MLISAEGHRIYEGNKTKGTIKVLGGGGVKSN